ncbi:hypothetical protein E8E12_006515 [Didymella heteroderae]|uniref:Uncharacterized protein n=1 Tax=Didymella heteroderae TaxID=1769908 RepID=A0A9P4WVF1_9PLEO|nr:hypothetical protein E8E12_006515 [Didymella heteroderae]
MASSQPKRIDIEIYVYEKQEQRRSEQQGPARVFTDSYPFTGYNLRPNRQSQLQEAKMDHRSPSPIQDYSPPNVDDDELPPMMQSQQPHLDRDSSSDDVPLRQQHPVHGPAESPRERSYDLRDRRQVHDYSETSPLDQHRAAHQARSRKPAKAVAKSTGKKPKKPGPRPWASKPIKKNDMVAKLEVIREIERHWGKGFIRAYIPKCHRPLVKRGKGRKRAMYREHEADPKRWLPSVLKAILSIATLTADKAWLKKAMNDVVRYRIKNTGNRKPQLVTTDFDVLEDMLVKDWDVDYSFGIRYKHLMTNPQGQQETDEDIDHILGVQSGEEGSGEEDDDVKGGNINDQDDDNVDDEDDSEDDMGQGGLTGQYLQASGYTNAPQSPYLHYTPGPPPKQQKAKLNKGNKRSFELPLHPQPPSRLDRSQQGYGQPHAYGPPLDPWGRPMVYGGRPEGYGYSGYGVHGGYGGYGPRPDSDGRCGPQLPPRYNGMGDPPRRLMTPAPSQPDTDRTNRKHAQDSPFGSNKRMRGSYEQSPFHVGRPQSHGYPSNFAIAQVEFKQESPDFEIRGDGREMSVEEGAAPTTELGENNDAAALEAELRATELELKVARLQAKRAALSQQSIAK